MARPNKQGLDYFPFDIDFFEDEKIEAISGEFGIKGELTAIKLLCAIYRNGYFILWNEMLKMKLLKNLPGVSSELLDNIVNRLVKWEFFDKNLFDSIKILTSRGIQNRFFSIAKRRNKSEEYAYLIINVDNNQVIACNNYAETELLHTLSTQRKVKESKVNEIKEKDNNPPLVPPREKQPEQSNISESIHDGFEKEKSSAKKERAIFTPPSIEMVTEFCEENSYTVNACRFVNYYTSNGWMVGKNRMKDWKAAVRTWQSKENENGNRQLPANNQTNPSEYPNYSKGNDAANKRTELANLKQLAGAVLRSTVPKDSE